MTIRFIIKSQITCGGNAVKEEKLIVVYRDSPVFWTDFGTQRSMVEGQFCYASCCSKARCKLSFLKYVYIYIAPVS